jgi:hypothetical protein
MLMSGMQNVKIKINNKVKTTPLESVLSQYNLVNAFYTQFL